MSDEGRNGRWPPVLPERPVYPVGGATAPKPAHPPRIRTNVILFVLTMVCTIYWGFLQYQQFYFEELRGLFTWNPLEAPHALLGGAPFGLAIITFLLAHEMGHYLACRHYKIAATLPYFIPFPPPLMFIFLLMPGTMGAVIRIRGAITSRRALFDIAVAGPIAGWLTALPILAYGLSQSRVVEKVELETSGLYFTLGEPLIWGPLARTFGPEVGPSQDLVMHPLAFVGWFALMITAFNLLPVGQLDGGHLLYAGVRNLHRIGSYAVLALLLFAGFNYFPGWIVFTAMISLLSLAAGGFRHPEPRQFEPSLGGGRILLMLLAIAIFATSFMLVPVKLPGVF
jgi:membrane-associated protease RseP (regulator of RpoE activity)